MTSLSTSDARRPANAADPGLQGEVASLIVAALNLDVAPEAINPDDPLYGEGLGLDSIDILEVALVVSQRYGFALRADNEDNVRIRFYFKEDENGAGFGNRLYLDEINFTTPTGINEVTKALALQVYPNPSNGASTLAFTLYDASQIKLSVYTVGGLTLYQSGEMQYRSGEHQILLNEKGEWSPGIYFVCLEYNGTKLMKKLVVE